jgi:1,2-phenylacetyl-CoA epoxidase PaaB subunit
LLGPVPHNEPGAECSSVPNVPAVPKGHTKHAWVGSVAAPDETFARAYAHEQYGRRGESAALWVVPRESILEVEDFVDELNRNYHRVDGYSLKAKLKEARERAGTAAPAGDS